MKKVVILTAILVLVLAGTTYAGLSDGPRITYGGALAKNGNYIVMDTLICVFNPNKCYLRGVKIHLRDKYGDEVVTGGLLYGGEPAWPIEAIPPKGWAWITLAMMCPPCDTANKFTWVVTWNPPNTPPDRGAVIEVKEIVFSTPIEYDPVGYKTLFWQEIKNASMMSETALGYWGVGYAPD